MIRSRRIPEPRFNLCDLRYCRRCRLFLVHVDEHITPLLVLHAARLQSPWFLRLHFLYEVSCVAAESGEIA